jgi:heterodisulfide reductase subunit B
MGMTTLVTGCPACLVAFKNALDLAAAGESRQAMNDLLDRPLEGPMEAKSLLQVIVEDVGADAVAERVTKPLTGLRVAPYYGCLLTRPPERAQFDDPENPTSMDTILHAVGANVPEFPFKTECCGASLSIPKRDVVLTLSGKVLAMAQDVGADAITLACPLCHQNLDLRQAQINAHQGTSFNLPILYITQVIGLAMGFTPVEMGLDKHAVGSTALLKKWEGNRREREESKE